MSTPVNFLFTVLVTIIVLYIVNMLPLDRRMKQVVQLIVIIAAILWLLRMSLGIL
jgi:hypothetical protein